MEALANTPQVVSRVFLAKENTDKDIAEAIKRAGIKPAVLGSGDASKTVGDSQVHQGVIGQVSLDKLIRPYKDFVENIKVGPDTALLLLGEVQDPHNVGAIIRSAAAFGISGVLIPEHNQAPVTGTVVKVSAGMAFRVPLVSIGNVNNTIRDLKERGFWIYGLDGEAPQSVSDELFEKPSVFIPGNESKGIRQKTNELCDILLSIPTNSKCESLNVAASTAIALYAWGLQHPDALNK